MTPGNRSAMLHRPEAGGICVSGNEVGTPESPALAADRPARDSWRIMQLRIGVIPLPVYLISAGVLTYLLLKGQLPTEINVAIAVLAIGGFTCAELGKHLPVIGKVGGAAIFATFIPSALVYYGVLPAPLVKSVTDFTKGTNFLYLFITAIIVGSILGMDRKVLISGFLRI